ncbi:hypothetical protein M5362_01875 [Streptomyces sp. Je 1-79]|uniref:hypothetical protein n=1 Tax=Streptomyces sp. Je 1-79 TaxID=2943847 RepID=UPI0021A2EB6E|nr:hypothetical protein [Streptomyces sp. Je 1-79]MCT4351882.1 hypothetical protein [Streptomyces sp. Je 1-79]
MLLLFIALRQVDAGLGRIEAPGHPTATVGPLVVPGLQARTAWCVWAFALDDVWSGRERDAVPGVEAGPGPQKRVDACLAAFTTSHSTLDQTGQAPQWRQLLWTYAVLDLCFAVGFAFLLSRGLRTLRPHAPPAAAGPFPPALYRFTRDARRRQIVFGLVIAELVEGRCLVGLMYAASPQDVIVLHWIALVAGVVKWAFLLLATALLALLAWHRRPQGTQWRQDVKALRLQLGVSLLLFLLLTGAGTDQVQDALLGLLDNPVRGIATLLSVMVLALLLWRSVHRSALSGDRILKPVPLAAVWIACGLAAVVSLSRGFVNLRALAVLLLVVAVLGCVGARLFAAGSNGEDAAEATLADLKHRLLAHTERLKAMARLVAALPLIVLAVFAVRAATVSAVVGPRRGFAIALLGCSVAVAVAGVFMPYALLWAEKTRRWSIALPPTAGRGGNGLYVGLAVLSLVFAGICVRSLREGGTGSVPAEVGPVAVATVFLCIALVLLNELQHWSGRATPMAGFRMLGFKQTPVFTLLVLWGIAAAIVDPALHHQVRITTAGRELPGNRDLAAEFRDWAAENCASADTNQAVPSSVAGRPADPVPLVIVAASGGGVRAAYWTSAVLGRMFPPGPVLGPAGTPKGCRPTDGRAPVFAVSGVSGGSLGAVSWLVRPPDERPGSEPSHKTVFGHDHLSSTLAWMMYMDLPRLFIGGEIMDRAAVLEQSWEHRQPDLADSFYTPRDAAWRPLPLLNGTAVQSGCRVLASPVQLGGYDLPPSPTSCIRRPESASPDDIDPRLSPTLIDLRGAFLCSTQDIRTSTAALLSARFPWVSPSGRFTEPACGKSIKHPLSVVDGGYVDGTGSLTAVDLLRQLQDDIDCHNAVADANQDTRPKHACDFHGTTPTRVIEPVIMQIDNGYSSLASTPPNDHRNELLVPLHGLLEGGLGVREATARQRAFSSVECGHYLRIANIRNPGTQAPLGWSLSHTAQEDLDRQLEQLAPAGAGLTLQARLAHEHTERRCVPAQRD